MRTEERPGRSSSSRRTSSSYTNSKARSGHPSRAGVLRVVAWMYLF
ncbi:MAG: hypothetical protein ACLT1A_03810 [Dysosmobacter sp.]